MTVIEYTMFKILRLFRKLPFNILGVGNQKVIFANFFKDFQKVKAVRGIFGEKTDEVLSHLTVEISWVMGYMYVDSSDGHLVISKGYLNNGDKIDIYLDLIHELFHIKQFMEGKELFDPRYDYVDRPTEIEAYRYTVQEAKRIGVSDAYIRLYLEAGQMSTGGLEKLIRNMGVKLEVS